MATPKKTNRKPVVSSFMDQERFYEMAARQDESSSGGFAPTQNHVPNTQADAFSGSGNESFFSRIGGMDGIMNGMSNIQKMYSAFKSIQPMFNLLGSFGPALQIKSVQQTRKRQGTASSKGRKGTIKNKNKSHR
ncbi:hypothetical protein ACFPYJ_18085 [Paenibacillus solisilvae]|uniref:Uncharacterized protein n=1 Tax=Paenibacillus solisilvae TaxID=2486751 RepID=A0ABW0W1M5_9BACL